MKKFLSFCLVFSALFSLSFSEPLKQFQTFSWKKVAKAKKYEIIIEKESLEETGTYVSELSQELTDNHVELLLYPGNYRVAISVFNVLGKKTSTTPWTNFIILDETQPYLYADSFKNSQRWNSPLLNLKADGVQIVEEEDDEGAVTAREGDPTNSFFLHGKNIFFEETTFSLAPKVNSETGNPFEAYVDLRKEIPLNIVRRDTENSGVVVEYNPDELFSGYYDIVVQNPGGEQTSLELLVLSYQPPVIDKSIYTYDENYKVNVLNVTQGSTYDLIIHGTGFDSNTLYTFTPDSSLPPYPFASSYEPETPDFSLNSHTCLDETGTIELKLNLSTSNLHTGYYCFRANNGTTGSDSMVFLVKVAPAPSYAPAIEKIKTKTSGASETILYNVTGSNIDEDSKITLIAPYSEKDDNNERIPIAYVATKKDGTLHVLQSGKDNIEPGRYAMLVENTISSTLFYFDINEKFTFTPCDLSAFENETLFLRPKTKSQVTTIAEKIIESNYEILPYKNDYHPVPKIVFSAAHLSGSVLKIPEQPASQKNIDGHLAIDLIHFPWFRLDGGMKYYYSDYLGATGLKYGGDMFVEIPLQLFQPYFGAGFYTTQESDYTISAQAGLRFFNFLEFTYQIELMNATLPNQFFTDKYTVGAQVPIRAYRYIPKDKKTTAKISENQLLDGTQYKIKKSTTFVELDSQRITGFNGNTTLEKIKLSQNVQSVDRKAFADMPKLSQITLYNSLQFIGEQAFANDTAIKTITIPESVTTIEKGAFVGWTEGQTIKLTWTSDDETPRDLSGLKDTKANILYLFDVPFNTEPNIYSPSSWTITNTESSSNIFFLAKKNKNNTYSPSLNLFGNVMVKDGVGGSSKYLISKNDLPQEYTDGSNKGIKFSVVNKSKQAETTIVFTYTTENSNELKTETYTVKSGESLPIKIPFKRNIYDYTLQIIIQPEDIDLFFAAIKYDITLSNFEPVQ